MLQKENKWPEIEMLDKLTVVDNGTLTIDIFKKKIAFFDLDGTIYLSETILDGAVDLFEKLRANNVDYYFLSNNCSQLKADYVNLLNRSGIICQHENIILPTDNLLHQLIEKGITEIFLVGNSKLESFFQTNGIQTQSEMPQCIIISFDTELTYQKLQKASILIQNGVPYMATNLDMVCPTNEGFIPDTGAICQLLETTTGIKPIQVFGKPMAEMIKPFINDIDINDVVIVGDRTYTDMELAKAIGCDFILTLTGETKIGDIGEIDYDKCQVIESIADLLH